ncbi:MAG: 6-phosphofructokinase [Planctomycetota bacterium]|nr:6-phosphofructokinase [Planctomycetota bacterium]
MAAKTTKRSSKSSPPSAPVGNAILGQSGGPTVVINESLVGLIKAASDASFIPRIFGARHGVQGILDDNLVELTRQSAKTLEAVAGTPAAGLGSVRKKPTRNECLKMFETFRKRDVRYLFYIGGNDTAETANILLECARTEKYPLRVFHVPKTIDNDLMVTDHCPGYGSAAKFVAQAFMGDNLDNRSLRGVKINVVMGRHGGFLTAAAALGRTYDDDGPHLVYVPEVTFNEKRFIADVRRVHKRLGRCLIAVSEGIHDAKGVTFAEKMAKKAERDAHGNIQLSGSGALGDALADLVRRSLPKGTRVRADTFGYLQRSFVGCVSEVDAKEARMVGKDAVAFAAQHSGGTVVLKRAKGKRYKCVTALAPLHRVAKFTKSMPRGFVNKTGNDVTRAFLNYAKPLAGPLPPLGRLKGM